MAEYFEHLAGPPEPQVQAHEDGDGHGRDDGKCPPGAAFERVDDNQRHNRQQDDHDHQHGDEAVKPPTLPISSRAILPSDLPSRRMEQKRMTKSCMAPPSTAPMMIHRAPGR